MNGPVRKIEILSPFNQAIELTRLILFRPFDITKWLIVGFAAFLSGWLNSGGGSINPWSFRGWNTSSAQALQFQFQSFNLDHAGVFLLVLIAVLAIFIFAIVILWLWITSRGRFIFIDCLVCNRAAIAEPWREYHREGNRFFLFLIVLIGASIAIVALLGGFVFGSLMLWRNYHISNTPALLVLVPIAVFAWVAFAVVVNLILYFMPPVMHLPDLLSGLVALYWHCHGVACSSFLPLLFASFLAPIWGGLGCVEQDPGSGDDYSARANDRSGASAGTSCTNARKHSASVRSSAGGAEPARTLAL